MRKCSPTVALLAALLCAAALLPPVAAQPAKSRAGGDSSPQFVADAQAVQDLEASGFLSAEDARAAVRCWGLGIDGRRPPCHAPLPASFPASPAACHALQQANFDFGADSANATLSDGGEDGGRAEDGFGLASGVTRLPRTGRAVRAYEPEPISPYGTVGLACSSGFLDDDFLVWGCSRGPQRGHREEAVQVQRRQPACHSSKYTPPAGRVCGCGERLLLQGLCMRALRAHPVVSAAEGAGSARHKLLGHPAAHLSPPPPPAHSLRGLPPSPLQ